MYSFKNQYHEMWHYRALKAAVQLLRHHQWERDTCHKLTAVGFQDTHQSEHEITKYLKCERFTSLETSYNSH